MECKNLELYCKQTKNYELLFKENGLGVDITDWTVYMTVKTNASDSDAIAKIDKKVTTHTDAPNGKTIIELSSTDTDLDAGNYYYDIAYKDDDSNEGVLFQGRLRIIEPIRKTRD